MFLYRDEYYNEQSEDQGLAEVILAKHRNGPIGTEKLAFLKRYAKFSDLAPQPRREGGGSMTRIEHVVWLAPSATHVLVPLRARASTAARADGALVPRRRPRRERARGARPRHRRRVRPLPRRATSSSSAASNGRPTCAPHRRDGSSQLGMRIADRMIDRQHVWVGPEATSFEAACEACLARRGRLVGCYAWSLSVDSSVIEGTLRREADVGFTTCRRGHRIVVRRVGRSPARLH